ncbi:MAG: hypothetical protein GX802_06150 [Clostridiales bacterium]|nr:hypothetical protein [Clostridiales bacterium]
MIDKYIFMKANISGTDTNITPEGYLEFPEEYKRVVMEHFHNNEFRLKRGFALVRIRGRQSCYMRACAMPQTELTSQARACCIHAEIDKLNPEQFFDENLDILLGFRFANESEIVSRTVPTQIHEMPVLPSLTIDNNILNTIIVGCFARWINRSKPLFICLPDEDFDNKVNQVIKSIYLAMPYALRAFSGFITFPTPNTSVPEFVSLCFFPESQRSKYAAEAILTLNLSDCTEALETVISNSRFTKTTLDFINFYTEKDTQARKAINRELFETIEGNGDNELFSKMDGNAYGDLYALQNNWSDMPCEERYKVLLNGGGQRTEILSNIVIKFAEATIENDMPELISAYIENTDSFVTFADAITPLSKILKLFPKIQDTWDKALLTFADSISNNLDIKNDYDKAAERLCVMFDEIILDACKLRVMQYQNNNIKVERDQIMDRIKNLPISPLASYMNASLEVLSKIYFEENKVIFKKDIGKNLQISFSNECVKDSDYKRYDELKGRYELIVHEFNNYIDDALHVAWQCYISNYIKLLKEKNISASKPSFITFLAEIIGGNTSAWMRVISDYSPSDRHEIDLNSIMRLDTKKEGYIGELYSACCKLSIFGENTVNLIFFLNKNNTEQKSVKLSNVKKILFWLISGENEPYMDNELIYFSAYLSSAGVLNNIHVQRLLSCKVDDSLIKYFVRIALDYDNEIFTDNKGKKIDSISFLKKNHPKSTKEIDGVISQIKANDNPVQEVCEKKPNKSIFSPKSKNMKGDTTLPAHTQEQVSVVNDSFVCENFGNTIDNNNSLNPNSVAVSDELSSRPMINYDPLQILVGGKFDLELTGVDKKTKIFWGATPSNAIDFKNTNRLKVKATAMSIGPVAINVKDKDGITISSINIIIKGIANDSSINSKKSGNRNHKKGIK